MSRVFSNGPNGDYVSSAFSELLKDSTFAHLVSPIFADANELVDDLVQAAKRGNRIRLLIGLNEATSPSALRRIHEESDISIRYLTSQFHARIYIFDKAALLGSANLTDGGLRRNRGAVVKLDNGDDTQAFDEVRSLFAELWELGQVLTRATLDAFETTHNESNEIRQRTLELGETIEAKLEKARPPGFNDKKTSRERVFLETLRQEVYERYRPAFREVADVIREQNFRREEFAGLDIGIETNRFLNYVWLTHGVRSDFWKNGKPVKPIPTRERRELIIQYAQEWVSTSDDKVPTDYMDWMRRVKQTFGTRKAIETADRKKIAEGLKALHAFHGQLRFVKGGLENLSSEFWRVNNNDLNLVKETLSYLVHGPGEFIQRLHDTLYDESRKLRRFGKHSALELYGTIKPDECPPINGRMVNALKFLGFNVEGN